MDGTESEQSLAQPPLKRKRGDKPKRTWKARLGEFAIWAVVAIVTALILISMSETLLPNNF